MSVHLYFKTINFLIIFFSNTIFLYKYCSETSPAHSPCFKTTSKFTVYVFSCHPVKGPVSNITTAQTLLQFCNHLNSLPLCRMGSHCFTMLKKHSSLHWRLKTSVCLLQSADICKVSLFGPFWVSSVKSCIMYLLNIPWSSARVAHLRLSLHQ